MAAQPPVQIKIEGVRELTRAIARVDVGLRLELGRANREIGQRIIDEAWPGPPEVGTGPGARPRPSASANVLRIVAGGQWRSGHVPVQQWGSQWAPREGDRPYLARAAEVNMPRVEGEYLDALADAARKAGMTFRKV